MAADEVPAEAIGRQHRAFEVHRRADRERAERGQRQRLGGRIDRERGRVEVDHGQAHTVHRDALAERDVVERKGAGADAQTDIAATGLALQQRADRLDQTCEHVPASFS